MKSDADSAVQGMSSFVRLSSPSLLLVLCATGAAAWFVPAGKALERTTPPPAAASPNAASLEEPTPVELPERLSELRLFGDVGIDSGEFAHAATADPRR